MCVIEFPCPRPVQRYSGDSSSPDSHDQGDRWPSSCSVRTCLPLQGKDAFPSPSPLSASVVPYGPPGLFHAVLAIVNRVFINWIHFECGDVHGSDSCCSEQVGMEVAPQLKDNLNRNFFDLLGTFRQISGENVQNQLVLQRVEVPEYLTLYSPAINWILQCIAYRAPEVNVSPVLRTFLMLKDVKIVRVYVQKSKSVFAGFYFSHCWQRWWRGVRPWATSECFFEIPEGIWVQYLCSVTHYAYKPVLTPSVCMVPTVLCCWTLSWGHSDLSLLRPVPPISSLWSKTVTRLASPRSEVTN